jgi:hypothetical protein
VPSKNSTCVKQLKGLEGHEEGGCSLKAVGVCGVWRIKLFCMDAPVMGGRYALLVLFSQDINEQEH